MTVVHKGLSKQHAMLFLPNLVGTSINVCHFIAHTRWQLPTRWVGLCLPCYLGSMPVGNGLRVAVGHGSVVEDWGGLELGRLVEVQGPRWGAALKEPYLNVMPLVQCGYCMRRSWWTVCPHSTQLFLGKQKGLQRVLQISWPIWSQDCAKTKHPKV